MSSIFKTAILLSALTSILLVMGYFLGGTFGLIFMLGISIVFNFVSYFFSDKIALTFNRARQINEQEYPEIFLVTNDLSKKMGIPMPRLYVTDSPQPNAFATGRNPNNSAVCLTTGIISKLPEDELSGVIAHELAHIKNRDVLIATIAAVIAGAIASITDLLMFNAIFGSNDEESANPLVTILLMIFAPLIATILQLSISRNREYLADATAAKYTRNPKALANALIRIQSEVQLNPMQVNSAMASLYFQNPFNFRGISELFSTHPATEKRVEALLNLKF